MSKNNNSYGFVPTFEPQFDFSTDLYTKFLQIPTNTTLTSYINCFYPPFPSTFIYTIL